MLEQSIYLTYHAANERNLDVIDPDVGDTIEGKGVTSPDVLRVQFGDLDVLNDDVSGALIELETLASDDTGAADTKDSLV